MTQVKSDLELRKKNCRFKKLIKWGPIASLNLTIGPLYEILSSGACYGTTPFNLGALHASYRIVGLQIFILGKREK